MPPPPRRVPGFRRGSPTTRRTWPHGNRRQPTGARVRAPSRNRHRLPLRSIPRNVPWAKVARSTSGRLSPVHPARVGRDRRPVPHAVRDADGDRRICEGAMTGSSLATLLVLALTAAASPFSLIVFSLVLATDRGARNGFAFICGWVITVVLIGVVMIALGDASDAPTSTTPRKWFLALQLALGTVLIIMFIRRRLRGRPIEEPVEVPAKPEPAWQRRIATMRAPGALILGGATQTWPVMIAAGAEIARLDIPHGEGVLWMFLFALATTAGIVVLEILAIRHPGTAATRLNRIRAYVDNHRDSVVNWAYLLGGLFLVYR